MVVFTIKTAGRAVVRQSKTLRQPQITKRHQHNPTNGPEPRKLEETTNTSIPVPSTVATLPLWQRLGPLTRAFSAYGRAQRTRPYTTQFLSSLAIYFCGDMSAQSLSGEAYDPFRTLRALVIASGSSIPNYKWYGSSKPLYHHLQINPN
jgi:protein Mpv17